MGVTAIEEVEGLVAQLAVAGIALDGLVAAGSLEGHREDVANGGGRSVGHHHHPIGQEQGLIDVVGDHQHRGPLFAPDAQQLFLQLFFGDRIEGPEGLIQHQHRRAHR